MDPLIPRDRLRETELPKKKRKKKRQNRIVTEPFRAAMICPDPTLRELLLDPLYCPSVQAEGFPDCDAFRGEWLAKLNLLDLLVLDLHGVGEAMSDLLNEINEAAPTMEYLGLLASTAKREPRWQAIKHGVGNLLAKPIDSEKMISSMTLLAKRGALRRKARQQIASGDYRPGPKRRNREIFLSFSNKDRTFAAGFRAYLESKGLRVWYSHDNPGQDGWRYTLINALQESKAFVALISKNYVSGNVVGELQHFASRGNPKLRSEVHRFENVFPLKIENVDDTVFDPLVDRLLDEREVLDIGKHTIEDVSDRIIEPGLDAAL